jgi:homoserine dehydrogenase
VSGHADGADPGVCVLKLGGSVLRDHLAVRTAAAEVARFVHAGRRVVAVVSALEGTTDRLLAAAAEMALHPEPFATAQLLSTGELGAAALLALALDGVGVRAATIDAAGAGLTTEGPPLDATPVGLRTPALTHALAGAHALVIPGFVGRDAIGRTTLLGRGGSDLTALFIAERLGAACRLIKDVDGLYEWDPARPGPPPRRFETLDWPGALALDGTIVQHKAVRWAREHGLAFEVGAIGAGADVTRVGDLPVRLAPRPDAPAGREPVHAA